MSFIVLREHTPRETSASLTHTHTSSARINFAESFGNKTAADVFFRENFVAFVLVGSVDGEKSENAIYFILMYIVRASVACVCDTSVLPEVSSISLLLCFTKARSHVCVCARIIRHFVHIFDKILNVGSRALRV